MIKKCLVVLLSAGLMMGLSGCTSKKATEEETPADVAEVAGEAGGEDVAAADTSVDELGSDELSADEKLPEEGGTDTAEKAEEAPGADEFAETPADEMSGTPADTDKQADSMAATEPAPEPAPELMAEPTPEPTPEPSMNAEESLAAGGSEPTPMPEEEKKAPSPLRKIADTPYKSGKVWVNAVYLARAGDSLESISQKIYGSGERAKELTRINPTLKSRDVKVGDKIYYNSPQRPDDSSKLLTYYEDAGLAPEIYVVTKPENIRAIAKQLLGDTNSWKELWSTNLDLESKGELTEGTQIRYWASTAVPTMAQTAPPPAEPMMPAEPTPPGDMANAAPPPPPDAATSAPPPPPPQEQAANEPPPPPDAAATMAPPPPPPADLPPPPPPPAAEHHKAAAAPPAHDAGPLAFAGIEGQDQTMALGAGAILLLGGVLLIVMVRKRRSRRNIDFHTSTQTQIE